jgi:hypothetical protein
MDFRLVWVTASIIGLRVDWGAVAFIGIEWILELLGWALVEAA